MSVLEGAFFSPSWDRTVNGVVTASAWILVVLGYAANITMILYGFSI